MFRVLTSAADIAQNSQFFTGAELACKGNGAIFIDLAALRLLNDFRLNWGQPLQIASAYRSPARNKAVGGAPNSYHMQGRAFDIVFRPDNMLRAAFLAESIGFHGIILYPNKGFIHLDNREFPYHSLTV